MSFRILDACTLYGVNLLKVSEEIRNEVSTEFNLDADQTVLSMSLVDINNYKIPEEAIDYDSGDFDECMLESLLDEIVGKYPHYVVIALCCKWNGASGYKFCNNVIDTVARNYDISLSVEKEGNGAIKRLESSHDVPAGSTTYIVGLTEEEFELLEEKELDKLIEIAEARF